MSLHRQIDSVYIFVIKIMAPVESASKSAFIVHTRFAAVLSASVASLQERIKVHREPLLKEIEMRRLT